MAARALEALAAADEDLGSEHSTLRELLLATVRSHRRVQRRLDVIAGLLTLQVLGIAPAVGQAVAAWL